MKSFWFDFRQSSCWIDKKYWFNCWKCSDLIVEKALNQFLRKSFCLLKKLWLVWRKKTLNRLSKKLWFDCWKYWLDFRESFDSLIEEALIWFSKTLWFDFQLYWFDWWFSSFWQESSDPIVEKFKFDCQKCSYWFVEKVLIWLLKNPWFECRKALIRLSIKLWFHFWKL